MRNSIIACSFLLLLVHSCNPNTKSSETAWSDLFNAQNLQGWDTYIGPLYNTDSSDYVGQPMGLNNDPNKVFSVVQVDGQSAIRISGENFGGVSTTKEFENYHLQLQFKWGELKHVPRDQQKRDSGLLYHAVGPHGADFNFWMRSQEMQIQEGDCGDYWGVAGGAFQVPVIKEGENYIYSPKGEMLNFNETSEFGRRVIKSPDNENPYGEWNTVDLYCFGDTAVHVINGKVNMILYHSSQLEGDELKPLTKGKIQIQSEGAEIFYRNIKMKPIASLPKEFN